MSLFENKWRLLCSPIVFSGLVAKTGYKLLHNCKCGDDFASSFDLQALQPALDNLGICIRGIDYDLDMNPIPSPPDMGCYQFSVGPMKTLKLTLFLEGLYAGSGSMNPAIDGNTGLPAWGTGIADKVSAQLHQSTGLFDPTGP